MLDTSVIEDTNIVTATYDGSLGTEQVEKVREQLSAVIARHGSARLLVQVGNVEVGRIEPKALWEDLKMIGLASDLDRYAIVSDQGWLEPISGAIDTAAPFELRLFSADERDDAVAWLSE